MRTLSVNLGWGLFKRVLNPHVPESENRRPFPVSVLLDLPGMCYWGENALAGKKEIRLQFRAAVFVRDRYRCAFCGVLGHDRQGGAGHRRYHADIPVAKLIPLDAHHITDRKSMPNGGYVEENGISLCESCHLLAEEYHRSGSGLPGFSPAELYALIGSSRGAALRACS